MKTQSCPPNIPPSTPPGASARLRRTWPLQTDWSFRMEDEPCARLVDLPHCWNERDTFQLDNVSRKGRGIYCRTLPPRPHRVPNDRAATWELRSEGFYGTGSLHIDGKKICRIDGQYLGLRVDLGRRLPSDRLCELEIRLSNTWRRWTLPGKRHPDFLLYGGLAGRVWLERLPPVHLDERRLHVFCSDPLSPQPVVHVAVPVRNTRSASGTIQARTVVTDPNGEPVAAAWSAPVLLAAGRSTELRMSLPLADPQRWDIEQPHLYRIHCTLHENGRPADEATTRFGVRQAVFDGSNGFFLNRRPVRLRGVNRHESMPGFGNALPASLQRADARQIRDLGLNFVRLSHYPQAPAFLDACDEFGILVYAELASWKSVRLGPWGRAAARQLRAMIERDRHHPSVILWGFGNE